MLENVRLSFQGIWSHKMRSFLTMLGIIIGIASIISIVSTIKGTNEQIKQNLIGAGNNNVTVRLKQGDGDYWMDNGLPSGVSKLSDDQKKRIREQDQVENASFYTERTYVSGIAKGNTTLDSAKALGVDENYLSTCGYQIYQGRGFVESDFSKTHKVVLLDDTAVLTLFPDESPVGKTIEIMGEPFTVIGVIKKADSFQPVINSRDDYYTYNQESYPLVLMPDVCWPIVFQYDEPENAVVMAKTTEDMSTVGKTTADIMNESVTNTTDSLSYQAEDLLEKAKSLQELGQSTNQQLIWIASISLLVGGIGVMNIMLVSVTERTREIGIRKSLGAKTSSIMLQFLAEAAILTVMGGVIGIILGILAGYGICSIMSGSMGMTITPGISPTVILAATLFSCAVGVFFGIYPAKKAADLDPIDALRYE